MQFSFSFFSALFSYASLCFSLDMASAKDYTVRQLLDDAWQNILKELEGRQATRDDLVAAFTTAFHARFGESAQPPDQLFDLAVAQFPAALRNWQVIARRLIAQRNLRKRERGEVVEEFKASTTSTTTIFVDSVLTPKAKPVPKDELDTTPEAIGRRPNREGSSVIAIGADEVQQNARKRQRRLDAVAATKAAVTKEREEKRRKKRDDAAAAKAATKKAREEKKAAREKRAAEIAAQKKARAVQREAARIAREAARRERSAAADAARYSCASCKKRWREGAGWQWCERSIDGGCRFGHCPTCFCGDKTIILTHESQCEL